MMTLGEVIELLTFIFTLIFEAFGKLSGSAEDENTEAEETV